MANLADFNAAPTAAATSEVMACCESPTLAAMVTDGRPYSSATALYAAIDAAFEALTWGDIVAAMNAHPRIGERTGGTSATEQNGISATEQSGATAAGAAIRHELAAGNAAYEQRFGHIFLICASGLSGQQMLDEMRRRMRNTPSSERSVARHELRKITRLRMTKLLGL
jgi:2-oxo-4-hydroxy-4-carboxy-5-ureidoimidazoline decarboxylase